MKGMVEKAILLATEYHRAQKRWDGTPFILHPIFVGTVLKTAGFDEAYQTTGILHDILEDTNVPEEKIREFGPQVLSAVTLLTKKDGKTEEEYVQAILQNDMAAVVKSVDKLHNVIDAVAYAADKGHAKATSRAQKYVANAKKFYFGKFNDALDIVIMDAEHALKHPPNKVNFPPPTMKTLTLLANRRPPEAAVIQLCLDDPELTFYCDDYGEYYAQRGHGWDFRNNQWKLVKGGWIPTNVDLFLEGALPITKDELPK